MVLLYMVTWIPSIYPLYVSIYTSTMDPMGMKIEYVWADRPLAPVHRPLDVGDHPFTNGCAELSDHDQLQFHHGWRDQDISGKSRKVMESRSMSWYVLMIWLHHAASLDHPRILGHWGWPFHPIYCRRLRAGSSATCCSAFFVWITGQQDHNYQNTADIKFKKQD